MVGAVAATLCVGGMAVSPAFAEVNLVLAPEPQTVPVGAVVDIGLYAVSDDGSDQSFSALDVIFTWDPVLLELIGAIDNGPHDWTMSGFMPDEHLDGLNDSLLDGDAIYTVVSIAPATATRGGLLVTTFTFRALAETHLTHVVIEPERGEYSRTQVFGTDEPNQDVTGTLGTARVTIAEALLTAADVILPAGRIGEVVVSGEIAGASTYAVTIMMELVPRAGAVGTMTFTPAPPVDIRQIEDAWPGAGSFIAYDTNATPSLLFNGSIDDDGTFIPAPVTFAGALAGFPVIASADARGIWDVMLSNSVGGDSSWEGLATAMGHATLTVVKPGDGDGSEKIDVRDFSELQACYTGPVGPIDPPAYALEPALRCVVYDFDDDGDVDAVDYAAFYAEMAGPAP